MENQQTQTLEGTVEIAPPVVVGETEGESAPDVAVTVDGVEVEVTDTSGALELTPVTGLLGVLLLGLLAVAVTRLRKK